MPLKMYDEKKPVQSKIQRVIAIAAGKGGVGKSTVAVNLARALKIMGFSVGLMDTDVYGPSVRRMLPEDRMPSQKNERITPAFCEGIRMISMAYFRKEGQASVMRAPIANGVVTQFVQKVDWGELDYLLIDFPPGTGDIQLTLCQRAHLTGAVMVTTPQALAQMDVKKAMDMFRQVTVPIVGIIENMSGYRPDNSEELLYLFGKGGGLRLAQETGNPYLGSIPIDPEISLCSDEGRSPFVKSNAAAQAFFEIAKQVHQHTLILEDSSKGSLDSFEVIWKEMKT